MASGDILESRVANGQYKANLYYIRLFKLKNKRKKLYFI